MTAVIRAEWVKLRTTRSAYLLLGLAVALGAGVGAATVVSDAGHVVTAADRAAFDPLSEMFTGFGFGQLALGALGVLAVTTEYASGMIRATFLATPRRGRVFAAKAMLLAVFAAVVCEAAAWAMFAVGQLLLSGHHLTAPLTASTLRVVATAGLYMAVVTMTGFGLGALIRHTGGALVAMFALVFLSWPAARATEQWSRLPDWLALPNVADRLAAARPITGPHADRIPSLGLAYLDLVIYLVVFLGLGAWRMRRDA